MRDEPLEVKNFPSFIKAVEVAASNLALLASVQPLLLREEGFSAAHSIDADGITYGLMFRFTNVPGLKGSLATILGINDEYFVDPGLSFMLEANDVKELGTRLFNGLEEAGLLSKSAALYGENEGIRSEDNTDDVLRYAMLAARVIGFNGNFPVIDEDLLQETLAEFKANLPTVKRAVVQNPRTAIPRGFCAMTDALNCD